jgi:hypothetical protein
MRRTAMPTDPPSQPPRPAQPRLLSGAGGGQRGSTRTGTETQTSFPKTLPLNRTQPATAPARPYAAAKAAPPAQGLPRWAKGFVIGGLLLAAGMPLTVLMSRSMLEQEAMAEQSNSKAAMICTGGEGRALDDSSVTGWLFGGSYFHCGDWETREARQQRDRAQSEANYLARQRARQGAN